MKKPKVVLELTAREARDLDTILTYSFVWARAGRYGALAEKLTNQINPAGTMPPLPPGLKQAISTAHEVW